MLVNQLITDLEKNIKLGLQRKRLIISSRQENFLNLNNTRHLNFSNNDYLGLATHQGIKNKFIEGVEKYGFGSSASALVAGYYDICAEVEESFATFLNRDATILFNCGYMANLAVLATFAKRRSTIIADKLCHASILDGIKLSGAQSFRYRHNDTQHFLTLLKKYSHSLIITEGVFSMEGDISPLAKLSQLSKKHKATLIVDDAHGIGVLGKTGKGTLEHFNLSQRDVPCVILPLGKAFGAMGAVVCGQATFIESLVQFARTYRYSTALPPAIVTSLLYALQLIQKETWRREKLQHLIQFFIKEAKNRNLALASEDCTPIKSILVGDNQKTLRMQKWLMTHHVLISSIRPPTVAKGTARLRISLNCLQQEKDIILLLDLLAKYHD